jgi:hypothetical protein
MVINNESFVSKVFNVNLVAKLWLKINFFTIFKHKLLKFIKLAKITFDQLLGSMEDEWCFSIMAFMKNKLKNHLTAHLDLCI